MQKQFVVQLVRLLKTHYKKDWSFHWKSQDDGFELYLQIFNNK
jgi:hypothetical protein